MVCRPFILYAVMRANTNIKNQCATNVVKRIVHINQKKMNCPYCEKQINGMTGLQELQKFHKHLQACKKHPDRKTIVTSEGELKKQVPNNSMMDALNIRAESGQ